MVRLSCKVYASCLALLAYSERARESRPKRRDIGSNETGPGPRHGKTFPTDLMGVILEAQWFEGMGSGSQVAGVHGVRPQSHQ